VRPGIWDRCSTGSA